MTWRSSNIQEQISPNNFYRFFGFKCVEITKHVIYTTISIPYTTSNTLQKFQTEDYYGANAQGKLSNYRWIPITTTNVSVFAHTFCYAFRMTLKQKTSIFLNCIKQKFCITQKQWFFCEEWTELLYRVIQNDCRSFNNLSYTIHLR